MLKGKRTCFWKDQATTVMLTPGLQLSAEEARGLLRHKRGKHDALERLKQLVTNGSEAGLVERVIHQKKKKTCVWQ